MRPKPSDILKMAKKSAFLVSSPTNLCYLSDGMIEAGLLLVQPRRFTLFVYDLEEEDIRSQVRQGITVKSMSLIEKALKNIKKCGFESDEVRVEQLRKWKRKFKNTKFVRTCGIIEEFRRSKDDKEIRILKKALSITNELLRRVPSALKRFPTEKELAWKLESWARELGAEGLSFDPIVAFGSHSSRPHHRATNRKLKRGHIVQIDVGAKYKGYCGDRSEVFFTAPITKIQEKTYRAVEEAKNATKNIAKPGVTNHALDKMTRKVLAEHAMEEYLLGCGHGVGLDIHEGVILSQRTPKKKLLKNEVITIEPGVYIPRQFGIRLEDMVFVK